MGILLVCQTVSCKKDNWEKCQGWSSGWTLKCALAAEHLRSDFLRTSTSSLWQSRLEANDKEDESATGDNYWRLTLFVAGILHAHPPRPHRLPVRLSTLLHIHAKFKCNYNSKQIPFKALTTSLTPPPIHVNWSSLFWNDIQQCLFQNLSMEKYHSPWYMYCIDSRSKVYWQFYWFQP